MGTTITFTPTMIVLVGGVAAFLQGLKTHIIEKYPRLDCVKAFLPIVAILTGWLLAMATKQTDPLISGVLIGMAASWGYDMFSGLSNGKKPIIAPVLIVCCLGILIGGGCNKMQMSPQYQQVLEMSAINVGELDKRCQGGDEVACKAGLHLASRTLNLLVDATHGLASDPNS